MSVKKVSEKQGKSILERIKPVDEIPTFEAMAVYGRAGTGKTAFGGTYPKPILFVDVRERGTKTVSKITGIDVAPLQSWKDLEDLYWELKDGKTKYKSVVIDHWSAIQTLGMERIREQENMEPDEMFSKRCWGMLSGLMQTWVFNYCQLWDANLHVCNIAHERATTGEEGLDDQIDPSVGPRLMPSVASFLNGCVSSIGRTFIREVEEEVKVGAKTKTVTKVQFCMRVAPHSIYAAKLRRPVDSEVPIPDIIVNPTFEKIQQLSRGESIKRKVR